MPLHAASRAPRPHPLARPPGRPGGLRAHAVRDPLAHRLLLHRRGDRPPQRGAVRTALRLRRAHHAERAREPVAGDRGRPRHRHHGRLDRRAAGGDPLHLARRRPLLPRQDQPRGDGLLRRRLRRVGLGQLHRAHRLRPAGDDHRDRHHVLGEPAHSGALLRLRVRLPRPREGHRPHRRADARPGDRARRAGAPRDLHRTPGAGGEWPVAPGRHRGERARAEGQGDRLRRLGRPAPAAGRLPEPQGVARARVVRHRGAAARRSGLRRAGRRIAAGSGAQPDLAGVEGAAADSRGVRRGARQHAGDGPRGRHRHALRRRGRAGDLEPARSSPSR